MLAIKKAVESNSCADAIETLPFQATQVADAYAMEVEESPGDTAKSPLSRSLISAFEKVDDQGLSSQPIAEIPLENKD